MASKSRVLILIYLLCVGHPSEVDAFPKECSNAILGFAGYGSPKSWAEIFQCVTKIFEEKFEQESDTAKHFQRVYGAVKSIKEKAEAVLQDHSNQSGAFKDIALSRYLATLAFDLYWKELPRLLENRKEYQKEIDIIYRREIIPVLDDIDKLLKNWQEYENEKTAKHILSMLEAITKKLSEFLQKIKVDKLKAIENEGNATVFGAASGTVTVGAAVAVFAFPPAGAVMAVGYGGTFLVGTFATVVKYMARLNFVELKKQLAELQDKTYKYKDQVADGKTKVRKILLKSYRTERPRDNQG